MEAHSLNDDPREILSVLETSELGKPMLLNIKTNRIFWHAGAGIDDPNIFDRHKKYIDYFGNTYSKDAEEIVRETWKKHLR
jgi:hypothetical protein